MVIIVLFINIIKLLKSLKTMSLDAIHLTDNLQILNKKINEIEKTMNNFKIISSVVIVISLIKAVQKDYKKTKSDKKNVFLSLAKVGAKNISSIKKIKFI